jgi:hypothetical protein
MMQSTARAKARAAGQKVRRWVRRRIIVDPAFQFGMLLPVMVFVIVQAVLLGAAVFYPLHQSAEADPDPALRALLGEQLLSLHVRFWIVLALAAVLVSLYTLLRSHRVAGPLYRLRRGLMKMAEGQYETLKFRSGDELRDFEGVAQRLTQKMMALSGGTAHRQAQLEGRLNFLKQRIEVQGLPPEEICRELENIVREFAQVQVVKE